MEKLPIDVLEIIAVYSGVSGWLAMVQVCRKFGRLGEGQRKVNIIKKLTEVRSDDTKIEYRINNILHRIDGPARIWSDGTQVWFYKGRKHRTDGPAHHNHLSEFYYIDGNLVNMELLNENKLPRPEGANTMSRAP